MSSQITTASMRIAFIGGGNMASALIGGLIHNGALPDHILAIDPMPGSRDNLSQLFNVRVAPDCASATNFLSVADLVIFAIKPQQFKEAAAQYQLALKSNAASKLADPLILSIAAGIRLVDMARWLDSSKVVRAMPNTPALVGRGVTGLCAGPGISKTDRGLVEIACQAVGKFTWVANESLINAVTAVSGSGPAYVFAFLEALQSAGESQGLDAEQARLLAIETLMGSAMLAEQSSDSPTLLREKVTSKGGTTFAALEVLREKEWQKALELAVDAASARGAEMGEEFGKN